MPSSAQYAQPAAALNTRIFRAALSVSLAGIVVKLAAIMKEVTVAGAYGRSDAMDAYLAAALVPGLLVNLIAESMNQALIPTLIRVRELEGRGQAQQLFSSAMLWLCALLVALCCATAATARGFFPLIASRFPPAKLDLSIHLFYGLLPAALLTAIASNCAAILNSQGRFAIPALAPAAISAATIAGVPIFGARAGIWAMVFATLAGSAFYAAAVAGMLPAHGYRLRLWWHGRTTAMIEVARQYRSVLLSGVVASGGLLVDQAMAAMLPAGSISALMYAARFVSVALTLLAGTLATVLAPHFSELAAACDWTACRRVLRTWAGLAALASFSIALLLIASSHGLVRIAFERGAFGAADTAIVTRVLRMYAIQIPFFAVSRVYYRFLLAMRRADLILGCGTMNLGLDVVLDIVLMRWMGVAGIALATSLWTVATFLFLGFWTRRVLREAAAGRRGGPA